MPKVALAETFQDWEGLLKAAAKHKDQKKLHVHLDKLQAAFDQLHELRRVAADSFSSSAARACATLAMVRPPCGMVTCILQVTRTLSISLAVCKSPAKLPPWKSPVRPGVPTVRSPALWS